MMGAAARFDRPSTGPRPARPPHSSSHKFDCLRSFAVAWLRNVPVTSVISGKRSPRTETGSVMIDVLRMGMELPSAGTDALRLSDASGEMRA